MKKITLFVLSLFLGIAHVNFAGDILYIWDRNPPGKTPDKPEHSGKFTNRVGESTGIGNVSKPSVEIFHAKSDGPRAMVIIAPGGSYTGLAYELCGVEIARWFAENGISAAVLKYRVPNLRDEALMDMRRAVRYIRANARELGIDPNRVGVMGFSAGANLAARTSCLYGDENYPPRDGVDKESARPDFSIIIYPAYLDEPTFQKWWGNKKDKVSTDYNRDFALAPEIKIHKGIPPTFIMQPLDDANWSESSIAYFLSLRKAGVPVNLHIYESGGHGFGIRHSGSASDSWEDVLAHWLKFKKIMPK